MPIGALVPRLKKAFRNFKAQDPFTQASALAYGSIFAIPGILIVTLIVASTLYDPGEVRDALFRQAGGLIGADTARELQAMVQNARAHKSGVVAQIIGVIGIVLSATSAFVALQSSLNRVWRVQRAPGHAVLNYLLARLASLALLASLGFLLLLSLVLDATLVAWLTRWGTSAIAGVGGLLASLLMVTLIFASVYKLLPDAHVRWREIWAGSLFTAVLFTVGKWLIGLYIARTDAGAAYGAGGAVVIILLWVYYSSLILLFGAHYTYVVATEGGRAIVPGKRAVAITSGPASPAVSATKRG